MKKDKYPFKLLISNIAFIIKFIFRVHKRLIFIRIPTIIVQAFATFIPLIFTRLILNTLTEDHDLKKVLIYSGAFALATFLQWLVSTVLGIEDSKNLEILTKKCNGVLGREIMKIPYYKLEDPVMKNYIALAESGGNFYTVLEYFTGMVQALVQTIGLFAIVLTLNPLILLVVIAVVAVRFLINGKLRKYRNTWRERHAPVERKMNYLLDAFKNLSFGKEIRVAHLENWFCEKTTEYFKENDEPLYNEKSAKEKRIDGFVSAIMILQDAVVYIILAYAVVFGSMGIGDFSMYLNGVGSFSTSLLGLFGCVSNLLAEGLFAKDFRYCVSFFDEENKKTDSISEELIPTVNDSLEIEFRNVSFHYPSTDKIILSNISIKIKPHETLTIVGLNGAGKTTFVKLLCRLYEPTEGEILINGVNIASIPYDKYYKLLSVVFQDFKLFPFTVRENIQLKTAGDAERLNESIKESGLLSKIDSLPDGVNTMVFKEFDENGIEFSGGEGQKMAIARAIYKNAPIIILDEPTSALDPIAEYDIYQHFNSLSKGKSTIYISHRLSSSRFTDNVAVFADGVLAEYGNHNELMKIENGIYRDMFNTQAQYYV